MKQPYYTDYVNFNQFAERWEDEIAAMKKHLAQCEGKGRRIRKEYGYGTLSIYNIDHKLICRISSGDKDFPYTEAACYSVLVQIIFETTI